MVLGLSPSFVHFFVKMSLPKVVRVVKMSSPLVFSVIKVSYIQSSGSPNGHERSSHKKKMPKSSLVVSLACQKLPGGKVACLAGLQIGAANGLSRCGL